MESSARIKAPPSKDGSWKNRIFARVDSTSATKKAIATIFPIGNGTVLLDAAYESDAAANWDYAPCFEI